MAISIVKHNFQVVRVDYPEERGYRMESRELPYWLHLEVEHDIDKNNKALFACSRIHVDKRVKVGPDYSYDFSDFEIIKDLTSQISTMFLR